VIIQLIAYAEFRAYQYLVRSNISDGITTKTQASYLVSTLNPQMYQSYHGGSMIQIDLLRTWMCPGYTGSRQKICDHPYDKENPVP
jgi:hypothetical protein